ncbi:MAG: 50S ribosomal protein L11 methyltransferase [Gammaproteobacteria bacterium]|nr:50S ribosomal protein L11 methyltransferase [Gammaproteobacteria bacterium]
MPWIRIEIGAPGRAAETIGEKLSDLGARAVTYLDEGDSPVLEPVPWAVPDPDAWSAVRVAGLFELDVDLRAVRSAFPGQRMEVEFVAEEDWMNAWRRFAAVRKFGRLTIVPSEPDETQEGDYGVPVPHSLASSQAPSEVRIRRRGERRHFLARRRSGKPLFPARDTLALPGLKAPVVMRLDPGLAFGTGSHPTTRLCLEWLAARDLGGRSVLDYGCGSGILAIAAKLLGAGHVAGVDHDPQALTATRANADRNGVSVAVEHSDTFGHGGGQPGGEAEGITGAFDIVLANIVSGTLVELAPRLSRCAASEGALVLCGVLPDQVGEVMHAYPAFQFRAPKRLEEWVLLQGERI